jgi:hypothetical protein
MALAKKMTGKMMKTGGTQNANEASVRFLFPMTATSLTMAVTRRGKILMMYKPKKRPKSFEHSRRPGKTVRGTEAWPHRARKGLIRGGRTVLFRTRKGWVAIPNEKGSRRVFLHPASLLTSTSNRSAALRAGGTITKSVKRPVLPAGSAGVTAESSTGTDRAATAPTGVTTTAAVNRPQMAGTMTVQAKKLLSESTKIDRKIANSVKSGL